MQLGARGHNMGCHVHDVLGVKRLNHESAAARQWQHVLV